MQINTSMSTIYLYVTSFTQHILILQHDVLPAFVHSIDSIFYNSILCVVFIVLDTFITPQ